MKNFILIALGFMLLFSSCIPSGDELMPTACFTMSEGEINLGGKIFFHNCSDKSVSYHYDFGDGNVSNAANPSYSYSQPGEYNVVLTVSNNFGENKIEKTVVVHDCDEILVLFDMLQYGSNSSDWLTSKHSALSIENGVGTFIIDFKEPKLYPTVGEFNCSQTIDCSLKRKMVVKVKLPKNPGVLALEVFGPIAKIVNGDGHDRKCYEVGDESSVNNQVHFYPDELNSDGDWQLLEKEIDNFHSSYPVMDAYIDSTRIAGVLLFYGFYQEEAISVKIEIDYAVMVLPSLSKHEVDERMNK